MNHLAQALLGAQNADVMFGSLITDFLRGEVDPVVPRTVRAPALRCIARSSVTPMRTRKSSRRAYCSSRRGGATPAF